MNFEMLKLFMKSNTQSSLKTFWEVLKKQILLLLDFSNSNLLSWIKSFKNIKLSHWYNSM